MPVFKARAFLEPAAAEKAALRGPDSNCPCRLRHTTLGAAIVACPGKSMSRPELIGSSASTYTRAVRMVCEEKGID